MENIGLINFQLFDLNREPDQPMISLFLRSTMKLMEDLVDVEKTNFLEGVEKVSEGLPAWGK